MHTEGDGPLGAAQKYCTQTIVRKTITCGCANIYKLSDTVLPSVCRNWNSTIANACNAYTIDGDLDVDALGEAVDMVLQNCMFEDHGKGTMEAAEGSDGSATVSWSVGWSVKTDMGQATSRLTCSYQCGLYCRW